MANEDAEEVDNRARSQEHRKGEEDPGEPGRGKVEEAQEVHRKGLVSSPPDVHHHECQRVAEEEHLWSHLQVSARGSSRDCKGTNFVPAVDSRRAVCCMGCTRMADWATDMRLQGKRRAGV